MTYLQTFMLRNAHLGGPFCSWCVTQGLPTSLILVTPLKRERIRLRAQFLIKRSWLELLPSILWHKLYNFLFCWSCLKKKLILNLMNLNTRRSWVYIFLMYDEELNCINIVLHYIFCKIPTKLFTKLTLWWIFHSWELYIFCPFWTFNVAFFPLKTRYLLQITKVVFQGSPSSNTTRIENTKKLE